MAAPCSVLSWKYLRSEFPNELLLHLTARGTRYCFERGRQHASQNVMLSVDLIAARAWQRCWDHDCAVSDCAVQLEAADGSRRVLKAKHALEAPPRQAVPSLASLFEFEARSGRPPVDAEEDGHGEDGEDEADVGAGGRSVPVLVD